MNDCNYLRLIFYLYNPILCIYTFERFYQGGCQADHPIVVEFIADRTNSDDYFVTPCPIVHCSSSEYQQFGFLTPVNYTSACLTPDNKFGTTTPLTLQTQYEIPIRNGSIHATQSVFGDPSQYFSPNDLKTSQNYYGLVQQPIIARQGFHSTPYCVVPYDCMESNLDTQYITALSQNTNTTYWNVNYSSTSASQFLVYLVELLELSEPPLVNSISYDQYEYVSLPFVVFYYIYIFLDYFITCIYTNYFSDSISCSFRAFFTRGLEAWSFGCDYYSFQWRCGREWR